MGLPTYRAWDASEKQMVDWPQLIFDPDGYLFGLMSGEIPEDTLMIGGLFLDKDKNLIYTSDLVVTDENDPNSVIGLVKFGAYLCTEEIPVGEEDWDTSYKSCFGFYLSGITDCEDLLLSGRMKVIGNEFENSDLFGYVGKTLADFKNS